MFSNAHTAADTAPDQADLLIDIWRTYLLHVYCEFYLHDQGFYFSSA